MWLGSVRRCSILLESHILQFQFMLSKIDRWAHKDLKRGLKYTSSINSTWFINVDPVNYSSWVIRRFSVPPEAIIWLIDVRVVAELDIVFIDNEPESYCSWDSGRGQLTNIIVWAK